MRIAFICGGLDPGHDGVGDYTRMLAAECQRQGHPSVVLGLDDSSVPAHWTGSQEADGTPVPTLRLASNRPWIERAALAHKFLDDFAPDWISLQFVPYSFHPKGLVHGLGRKLIPMLQGRKLHVMFHEIWLCQEQGWGWKQSMLGVLQRQFIRSFVRAVNPQVIHTTNTLYAAILNRSGIATEELGLFGNVPVIKNPGTAWIESQLRPALGDGYARNALWVFGFFGALHTQWPPEPLLGRLRTAALAAGKRPVILSIGRIGEAGLNLWNRIAGDYAGSFIFVRLGEQPLELISEYLSFIDCGIATTPRSIIGKSGTVITMLEHGLPVIVNREDAPALADTDENKEPLLMGVEQTLSRLQAGLLRGRPDSRRPQVTRKFLAALSPAISEIIFDNQSSSRHL